MSFSYVGPVTSASIATVSQTGNASLTGVTAGDLIEVNVWLITETPSATPSVTDDKGNTYYQVGSMRAGGIGECVGKFYTRTSSSGTHVITLDKGITGYYGRFVAANFAGVIQSGTVASVLNTSGNATTSTVNLTTTVDGALLTGIASSAAGDPGAGSGFTKIASPNEQWYSSCEYKLDAGSASSGKAVTFNYASMMIAAAYIPASGSSGGVSPSVTITSVSPTDGFVNSTQHVTITGTALTGGVLTVSGSNITVSNTVVTGGGTTLDADLAIAAGATLGGRTLTVTASGATATVSFTVRSRTVGSGSAMGGISSVGTPFLTAEITLQ